MNNDQKTLIDLLEHACAAYPNEAAYSALGHTLIYSELEQLTRSFAAYLEQLPGLERGDRIAVQLPNVLQYPVVAFGALRAGLVIVNTNPMYTARELEHQLKDSGAKALVVLENFAAVAESVLASTQVEHVVTTQIADLHPLPKRLLINAVVKYIKKAVPAWQIPNAVSLRSALAMGKAREKEQPLSKPPLVASDLAVLQYTGGTTGVSKGAMLSHHNLVANMEQVVAHVPGIFTAPGAVLAAPLPLYHIYAFNMHLLCSLSQGKHSVLIPNPRDIDSVVKVFEDYPLSVFVGLNTLYNGLMANSQFRALDFSALKYCTAGGMALVADTAQRWLELTGLEIMEGYGLTETSPVVAINPEDGVQMGTIGTLLPETRAKIIDESGMSLPQGEPGELCIHGPQVMLGYWQRPEETDKVLDEDGWLRTGDMAMILEDGYLKIVDRKKDMISVSGFKVFPNEVEDVASSHPQVMECAAIGVPDEYSGEVVKLVVVAQDQSLTEESLIDFCRERLTAYKVPKHVVFREELPKSNVGKILRREIREQEAN